jgi:phage shock protein B
MEHMLGFFFILMTAGLLLVGAVIFGIIRLFTRTGREGGENEAQMIQEMYQGLARMEERIETLETILLEKDGKERTL